MIGEDKYQVVEKVVDALNDQFGQHTIKRAALRQSPPARIPTGFAELDAILSGGIPQGRMTEINSVPSAGGGTMMLRTLANAQKDGGFGLYIDVHHAFDAEYAVSCGVNLEQLMVVRPSNKHQSLSILKDAVFSKRLAMVVYHAPIKTFNDQHVAFNLAQTLGAITAPLHKSVCALIFLISLPPAIEPPPNTSKTALPHYATVRLLINKQHWLNGRYHLNGLQAHVRILKNKLGQSDIDVNFPIPMQGST